MPTEEPDTCGKALALNLDAKRYGTFAKIGTGQEAILWFFTQGEPLKSFPKAFPPITQCK
ncbi:MAG: hypothetical protein M2R45_02271 [Verrucomicrobia subdivision 3 bacterium]|nr:hypothetical protein [Limisphaerales bacterium]MCS1413943.1 hypothetical protein [Limisphaerales bacterium]